MKKIFLFMFLFSMGLQARCTYDSDCPGSAKCHQGICTVSGFQGIYGHE